MKLFLVLISTITVNSSAILFLIEVDKYKVNDEIHQLDRIRDDSIKVNSLKSFDNEDENSNLEPRHIIKNKVFGVNMNQEKAQPKKLNKTFNFYAKRINRNNNQEIDKSIENINIRNSATASPVKFVKKTKYSKEENQDQKEFIFFKNKNVEAPKNKRRIRSIIEEENLFTTVSALKYTGRDTRLTNDLYFKNINQ